MFALLTIAESESVTRSRCQDTVLSTEVVTILPCETYKGKKRSVELTKNFIAKFGNIFANFGNIFANF